MLGPLTRRAALALAGSAAAVAPAQALAPGLFAAPALASQARRRFSGRTVIDLARQLSERPFAAPPIAPERFQTLTYSEYRAIRFRKEAAIWRGENVGFELELFAPGSVYNTPVPIELVQAGLSRPLAFDPAVFEWNGAAPTREEVARLGYTGFRVHSPLNRADYLDEFAVFQGASYFRGVAKGQAYGLSARGLAINTAQPAGEEFPIFRKFWIERPTAGAGAKIPGASDKDRDRSQNSVGGGRRAFGATARALQQDL